MLAALVPSQAGAFALPEGEGQFIAGVGYAEASRRFDTSGHAVPIPRFRKTNIDGYLDYGLTSRLGVIVAGSLARERDAPGRNAFNGSDGSAIGGRYQLLSSSTFVLGVQALVQPPLWSQHGAAADLRVMVGQSFRAFGLDGFVDLEPGGRIYSGANPMEAHVDIALGVRPQPAVLLLLQTFSSVAPKGSRIPRTASSQMQGSVVYDVTRRWSAQIGFSSTVAGRNAARERGPIAALWYRF